MLIRKYTKNKLVKKRPLIFERKNTYFYPMQKILFLLLFPLCVSAQSGTHKYFISFTDKANTNYSLSAPEEYLSAKTIAKRNQFFIGFDSTDIPVNRWYADSLVALGFKLKNTSKWFNGIIVSTTDSLLVNEVDFSFVDTIIYFGSWQNNKSVDVKWSSSFNSADYGIAYNQLQMLGGDKMHAKGFKGKGMTIAVIDAGFYKVDELLIFSAIQNQILGTYDFVDRNVNVYDDHTHGMMVLSTMGGNKSGEMIGTSPEANFYLLRSEDVYSENLIEEYYWVCAAEYADSVGADIINSSLGYTTFDNPSQNHTYADMDGNTAPVTIGATMAAEKGILVVNSAGNSGSSSWHYIGAPADANNIVTVGAVDENEDFASFSSYGPTADGRVKPTLMAQGKNTIVATTSDSIMAGNGTSFSSPVTAGMLACLWGANPKKSNLEIIDAVVKSADRYLIPDEQFGYGIPNYYKVHELFLKEFLIGVDKPVYSNVDYIIYAIDGRLVSKGSYNINAPSNFLMIPKPKKAGVYVLNYTANNIQYSKKFIVVE